MEEIIEVIEVTDDESGEEVTEEVVTTTTTTKVVAKAPSIDASNEKEEVKAAEKPVTITKQATIETQATIKTQASAEKPATTEAEESSSEIEVEEEEEEEEEEITETKTTKRDSVASITTKQEVSVKPKEESKQEEVTKEVTESLGELKITENATKPSETEINESQPTRRLSTAEIQSIRRASAVAEGVQRPIQQAVSIPQTAPVQQTAPIQQTAMIEQTISSTQSSAPTNYIQPQPQPTPATYAQPAYQQQAPTQIPQENIRNQLQEIVSDIDRAVEEQKLFSHAPQPTVRSSVTSQNISTTETWKQTSSGAILQKPSYFYQVCCVIAKSFL